MEAVVTNKKTTPAIMSFEHCHGHSTALNASLNLQPWIYIQSTAMRAAHRLLRFDLWMENERAGYGALGELNPVLAMHSGSASFLLGEYTTAF